MAKKKLPTIIDTVTDPRLLGNVFAPAKTWKRWFVFMKALYGLKLTRWEKVVFCNHTGRSKYAPPPGGYSEAVAQVGRQSGKTRIASAIAIHEALTAPRSRPGDETFALLVAQDHRSAMRVLFRYASAPFESIASLKRSVQDQKAQTITLRNGVTLGAYPCRPSSVRGLRNRVVVLDELAYYISSEGRPRDREMLTSIRPTLATTRGKLVALSSPAHQTGALYELHRAHYGNDDSKTLYWVGTAPEMNPTLSQDYLDRMQLEDPEAYKSEVLGEFRTGTSALFDGEALDAVVIPGRRELAPQANVRYFAFVDPSGGRRDAFTVGIGHRVKDALIVDVLRAWRAPFNPTTVVAEAADLLKSYRVRSASGDNYSGEWVVDAFRAHGIKYEKSKAPKSELYLAMLPVVNARRCELLDQSALMRELRGLERRRGSSGKDRVDHAPGSFDDRANALAGLLHLMSGAGVPMVAPLGVGTRASPWRGSGSGLPPEKNWIAADWDGAGE